MEEFILNLIELGWEPFFENQFITEKTPDIIPARIASVRRNQYLVYAETGELVAHVSGRFRNNTQEIEQFPTVGDWVGVQPVPNEDKGVIRFLLERKSRFSRKQPVAGGRRQGSFEGVELIDGGTTGSQVIAANIDTLFIVIGLDNNYSLSRIERLLTQAYNSGSNPVILLNKSDLCDSMEEKLKEVTAVTFGTSVHALSARTGNGIEQIRKYVVSGKTVAFVGSSGVGKSSIINAILGEELQKVISISDAVGKGRHTTTSRELIMCPGGGLLIDTPGMREFQLWCDEDDVDTSFEDIAELRSRCRFTDCTHETEPDCAVKDAMDRGLLTSERYSEYMKYQREIRYLDMKKEQRARNIEQSKAVRMGMKKPKWK
jgi:ribosome biogenesis GTPase